MKDVFMVRLDWSTTDADGIDTELYEDYDKPMTVTRKSLPSN